MRLHCFSAVNSSVNVVCYTAVFSVVTQWGGALRDDTKNGCVADYGFPGRTVISKNDISNKRTNKLQDSFIPA